MPFDAAAREGDAEAQHLLDLVKSREHMLAQQLALEQKQFERLKSDFKYNLGLLRERDAELEKYDVELATLRDELEQRSASNKSTRDELIKTGELLQEERRKTAGLQMEITEVEHRIHATEDQLARKAADATRLQEELDTALKERADALAQVTEAKTEVAAKAHEMQSMRTELTTRLTHVQQQMSDAEETYRSNLADERAQHATRLKQARGEATREASALQEQVDKLQAEAAEQTRSHQASLDELRSLQEAQNSEQLRAGRHREEAKRLNANIAELQEQVLLLTRKIEQQEFAAKRSDAEHEASMQRQAEEHARALAAERRQCEEREAIGARSRDEDVASAKRSCEARIAQLEADLTQERARVAAQKSSVAAAEERARVQGGRAEQLQAERNGLARDASALRAEAISNRERADVMQKMLNQRTEYIRKLQEAAARREEQMAAQYAEREKSAVDAAEQKLCHEVEAKEHLSRQLAEATHLHAEAERRIATLQGTLFATGKASQPRASLRGNEVSSCTPSTTMCKATATTMPTVAAAEAVEHRTPLPAVTTVPLLHTAAPSGTPVAAPSQQPTTPPAHLAESPMDVASSMVPAGTEELRPVEESKGGVFSVPAQRIRGELQVNDSPIAIVPAVRSNPPSVHASTRASQRASRQPSPPPPELPVSADIAGHQATLSDQPSISLEAMELNSLSSSPVPVAAGTSSLQPLPGVDFTPTEALLPRQSAFANSPLAKAAGGGRD